MDGERMRLKDCGCRYDSVTGLLTCACLYHASRFILKKDGREVCRGRWFECVSYVHQNHAYSFLHALAHEGYTIEKEEA